MPDSPAATAVRSVTDAILQLIGVVPAAGGSRRLGQPKQLLQSNGEPLLARCIRRTESVCSAGVFVVLGAHSKRVRKTVPAGTRVIENNHWQTGLASSLRVAIAALPGSCDAILIVMPDQTDVTAKDLRELVSLWRDNPGHIVCAHYDGIRGVPVVLPRRVFAAVTGLSGDRGAQSVLDGDKHVLTVAVATASFDLDTPADLAAWRAGNPE